MAMQTMNCGRRAAVACGVVVVAAIAGAAQAGVMLQPASASTNMGNFGTYEPVRAVNQSGLSAPYVSGTTDFESYVPATRTVSGASSFNSWFSQSSTTGNFDLDLGGSFSIYALALWNDHQPTAAQGVRTFTLLAANNPSFSGATTLGSYTTTPIVSEPNNFGQIFSFAPVTASYVRLVITANYGSTLTTGFTEVALAQVPAPGAALLMGLGLVGASARRRR